MEYRKLWVKFDNFKPGVLYCMTTIVLDQVLFCVFIVEWYLDKDLV